ncbi:MAG TPA: hypothetical protein VFI65_28740, partial [Streptosporangiaceae bacterium]|nr:hypothetical protein [Streptosporangiaceae bacterium]
FRRLYFNQPTQKDIRVLGKASSSDNQTRLHVEICISEGLCPYGHAAQPLPEEAAARLEEQSPHHQIRSIDCLSCEPPRRWNGDGSGWSWTALSEVRLAPTATPTATRKIF